MGDRQKNFLETHSKLSVTTGKNSIAKIKRNPASNEVQGKKHSESCPRTVTLSCPQPHTTKFEVREKRAGTRMPTMLFYFPLLYYSSLLFLFLFLCPELLGAGPLETKTYIFAHEGNVFPAGPIHCSMKFYLLSVCFILHANKLRFSLRVHS